MEADPYHGPAAEDGDAAAVQTRSPGDIVEGAPRAHAGSGDDGAAPSSEWFGGQQVSDGPIDQEDATINTIDDSSIHSGPAAATIVPPYWQNVPSRRRPSTHSSDSGRPPAGAILLLDNEADEGEEERNNACWARSVEIVDHTVVNGGATNIGAFVVWNVRVETLQGSYINIRKRYSEFDALRHRLVQSFPNFDAAVPSLPPKSVISKFRPKFLEKRRAGLQYFLNCIILNPEFSGSPVLKDFLFS